MFPTPDMALACGLLLPGAGTCGARAMSRAALSSEQNAEGLGEVQPGKTHGQAARLSRCRTVAERRPAAPQIGVHPEKIRGPAMNTAVESARLGVMHAMLSVSMSAQQEVLQGWQVNAMHERAMATLPAGDDLRNAVISFATRYPDLRRDAYAVRTLGAELGRALQIVLNPEAQAPVRYRSDVDG